MCSLMGATFIKGKVIKKKVGLYINLHDKDNKKLHKLPYTIP